MPTTITMRSDGTQGWDEEVRQRKNWRNREKKVGEEEQNEPEGWKGFIPKWKDRTVL